MRGTAVITRTARLRKTGRSPHEAFFQDAGLSIARTGTACRALINRPFGTRKPDPGLRTRRGSPGITGSCRCRRSGNSPCSPLGIPSFEMPQFIHLADDRDIALIRKNGIRARRVHGGSGKWVFAMPVLQNYYRSHQWLRELKRCGVRTISAVQFEIADDLGVKVGRYNEPHLEVTAAEAVRIFMEHSTGAGLEVLIPFSIRPRSITRIYTPDQIVGWRYYPESHLDGRPCGCPYCQRGQINNRKLREAYEAD